MSFYGEESQSYCSGQCQASRSPPVLCRCVCGGRAHGILRAGRVYDVRQEPVYQHVPNPAERVILSLPEERLRLTAQSLAHDLDQNRGPFFDNRTVIPAGPQPLVTAKKGKYRIAKTIGRSFKHALSGYSQEELNEHVFKGLRSQFNEDNTNSIIDQAYTVFYERVGFDSNRPELYELYENGDIDTSAGLFGKRWAVGRPKK